MEFDSPAYYLRSQTSGNVVERQLCALSPNADFAKMSSFADIGIVKKNMRIRTPTDLGAVIRDSRIKLGLNQKSLAERIDVSRQWIVEIEKGKPRAEISLVLRTVNALGITLDARLETAPLKTDTSPASPESPMDIDSIIAEARKPRK
jgi:HTH-type transcriptional regulator / antitoxin HipB